MSMFFEGNVQEMTTGWYDGTVKAISDLKVSQNGNEYVNVQFDLDGHTQPVFQAATQPFYDRIVLATGKTSRDPDGLVGERVAIRVEVDPWGNRDVKRVQSPAAPRTTEDFRANRTRVVVETPTVTLEGF